MTAINFTLVVFSRHLCVLGKMRFLSTVLKHYKWSHLTVKRLSNMSAFANSKSTIAIRREDNSVWERRAPLSPSDVRQLIKQDINVIVQPSNGRAYSMEVSTSTACR